MENHRDVFFKFYANLPANLRSEVILSLDEIGPITWLVAYREIDADSSLGKIILQKLVQLKFIPTNEK